MIEYDSSGKYVRDVSTSNYPYDLTEIDRDRIAVTYPRANRIEILNIKKNSVETKIGYKRSCYGISHHSGRIFTAVKGIGIMMMDITGNILETIPINTWSICCIAGSKYSKLL